MEQKNENLQSGSVKKVCLSPQLGNILLQNKGNVTYKFIGGPNIEIIRPRGNEAVKSEPPDGTTCQLIGAPKVEIVRTHGSQVVKNASPDVTCQLVSSPKVKILTPIRTPPINVSSPNAQPASPKQFKIIKLVGNQVTKKGPQEIIVQRENTDMAKVVSNVAKTLPQLANIDQFCKKILQFSNATDNIGQSVPNMWKNEIIDKFCNSLSKQDLMKPSDAVDSLAEGGCSRSREYACWAIDNLAENCSPMDVIINFVLAGFLSVAENSDPTQSQRKVPKNAIMQTERPQLQDAGTSTRYSGNRTDTWFCQKCSEPYQENDFSIKIPPPQTPTQKTEITIIPLQTSHNLRQKLPNETLHLSLDNQKHMLNVEKRKLVITKNYNPDSFRNIKKAKLTTEHTGEGSPVISQQSSLSSEANSPDVDNSYSTINKINQYSSDKRTGSNLANFVLETALRDLKNSLLPDNYQLPKETSYDDVTLEDPMNILGLVKQEEDIKPDLEILNRNRLVRKPHRSFFAIRKEAIND